jgi:hypothetical protein
VLAPALIAALLVVGGVRLLRSERVGSAVWAAALAVVGGGVLVGAFLTSTPTHFTWAVYLSALVLFGVGWLRL